MHHDDAALRALLDAALVQCRESIADYRAGIIDEDELRHLLRRDGIVRRAGETWHLDLEDEHWHRWVRDDAVSAEELSP